MNERNLRQADDTGSDLALADWQEACGRASKAMFYRLAGRLRQAIEGLMLQPDPTRPTVTASVDAGVEIRVTHTSKTFVVVVIMKTPNPPKVVWTVLNRCSVAEKWYLRNRCRALAAILQRTAC